jgi:hypothetical protein
VSNALDSPPAGRTTELLRWLTEEGRFAPDIGRLLEVLCEKLTALGVPIARATHMFERSIQNSVERHASGGVERVSRFAPSGTVSSSRTITRVARFNTSSKPDSKEGSRLVICRGDCSGFPRNCPGSRTQGVRPPTHDLFRAGSTGRCNTGVKSLCWGFECQGLPWPFV